MEEISLNTSIEDDEEEIPLANATTRTRTITTTTTTTTTEKNKTRKLTHDKAISKLRKPEMIKRIKELEGLLKKSELKSAAILRQKNSLQTRFVKYQVAVTSPFSTTTTTTETTESLTPGRPQKSTNNNNINSTITICNDDEEVIKRKRGRPTTKRGRPVKSSKNNN